MLWNSCALVLNAQQSPFNAILYVPIMMDLIHKAMVFLIIFFTWPVEQKKVTEVNAALLVLLKQQSHPALTGQSSISSLFSVDKIPQRWNSKLLKMNIWERRNLSIYTKFRHKGKGIPHLKSEGT